MLTHPHRFLHRLQAAGHAKLGAEVGRQGRFHLGVPPACHGGTPIVGWFLMEDSIEMDDDWGCPQESSRFFLDLNITSIDQYQHCPILFPGFVDLKYVDPQRNERSSCGRAASFSGSAS